MTAREEMEAALALAKWQGEVSARMKTNDNRFVSIDRAIERIEAKIDEQGRELTTIKVKFALMVAAGNIVFGFAVALATKAIGI